MSPPTGKERPAPSPLKHACGLPPPRFLKPALPKDTGAGLISKSAWSFGSENVRQEWGYRRRIMYAFIRDAFYTENKKNAVEATIKKEKAKEFDTWEDHANIEFFLAPSLETADIRIAFRPGSSWSAVGEKATDITDGNPTLNLGWLSDSSAPSVKDRAIILHEFGHACGMMHEHQSPARGEFITLDEFEVYKYYEPLLGSREKVKSQVIDVYNRGDILNMSRFDPKSIMMYFMPAHLNLQRLEVPVNTELSELDKALIHINYPPNLTSSGDKKTHAERLEKFIRALITVGITDFAAGEILDAFVSGNKDDPASCYKDARERFSKYNQRSIELRKANTQLLNSVDHEGLKQFGVAGFFGSIIKNPLFQSIVKGIAEKTLLQQGIQTKEAIPGASSHLVTGVIGGLSSHPQVGDYVNSYIKAQKAEVVDPQTQKSELRLVASGVVL